MTHDYSTWLAATGKGLIDLSQTRAHVHASMCRPLMEAHAHAICSSGGDVLNVGFGLGLIDEVSPFKHTGILDI